MDWANITARVRLIREKIKWGWLSNSLERVRSEKHRISSRIPSFISFNRLRIILRQTVGILTLIVATAGLVVVFKNPMTWISSFLPVHLELVGGWTIHIEQAYVQSLLSTLYTDQVVFGSALGGLALLMFSAGILLVQRPLEAMKSVGLGIKASPMAVVRSPLAAYRKVTAFRNWFLEKVDYLQAESAKWRTTFTILRSPYSLLLKLGFSPQAAIGLLFAGSAATTGVVASEIMEPPSFSAGDPGIYAAPIDTPIFAAQEYNTLRLDLGATSVGLVEIDSISLGTAYTGSALPSGEANVVIVGGMPAVVDPAFTETFLEVGTMYVDRWRCETLAITNSEIHKLVISGNASDGQSISAVAGTPRNRGINGGNRADDMVTSGGYYDQLKITAASSGVNGKVDVLRLTNLYSKGGGCVIDRVKAGEMHVTLNEIGGDSDLATKAFTIATSVIYKSFTNEENVEVAMAVPAIQ